MSMAALLNATKAYIQTTILSLTPGVDSADIYCDVTEEGQPKPNSGQLFYGLVGRSITNDSDASLDEYYAFDVTITLRTGYVPDDRIGNQLIIAALAGGTSDPPGGIWALTELLRAGWRQASNTGGLHMNYQILSLAGGTPWTSAGGYVPQSYSLPNTVNGFIEPAKFKSATYLGAKDPDWFHAVVDPNADPIAGVAVKLSFERARRKQVIESSS